MLSSATRSSMPPSWIAVGATAEMQLRRHWRATLVVVVLASLATGLMVAARLFIGADASLESPLAMPGLPSLGSSLLLTPTSQPPAVTQGLALRDLLALLGILAWTGLGVAGFSILASCARRRHQSRQLEVRGSARRGSVPRCDPAFVRCGVDGDNGHRPRFRDRRRCDVAGGRATVVAWYGRRSGVARRDAHPRVDDRPDTLRIGYDCVRRAPITAPYRTAEPGHGTQDSDLPARGQRGRLVGDCGSSCPARTARLRTWAVAACNGAWCSVSVEYALGSTDSGEQGT